MCRKLIYLIGLVAVFAWSANALAVTTLVDEFDSYPNGQINTATGGKWMEIGGTTRGFIAGAPGNPLNKVFDWTDTAGSWGAYGILSGNAIIPVGPTKKTLFLRILTTVSTTGAPDTGFGLTGVDTPGWNNWVQFNVFLRFKNGYLQAFNYAAPLQEPNKVPPRPDIDPTTLLVAANTWYNLWVVVDHSLGSNADTFKVYANTGGNATESDRLKYLSDNLDTFHFRTSADNTAALDRFEVMSNCPATTHPHILFDDIYVSDGEDLTAKPGKWASNPYPADKSTYDGTNVTLTWTPGSCADKHDVYFDDNFNDVNNATRASHPGLLHYDPNHLNANYPVTGLTAGATYYWRIDEVNAPPYASTIYKGNVWSFTTKSLTASNPSPPDKDVLVDPNANLSWFKGMSAAKVAGHKVYFDSVEAKVQARSGCVVNGVSRTEPNYIIGPPLAFDETYYWAIDEVNVTTWPGPVWSFKTWPDTPITEPNLVGWWKLEDSGGRKTLDSSGHNRHGTLMGDPNYATGISDQAINLDGINDWVSVGSVGISGAAPRTIAGWAKMNTMTIEPWTNVFGFTWGLSSEHKTFNIDVSGGGLYGADPGYWIYVSVMPAVVDNWERLIWPLDLDWHYFAATYDGATNNKIRWYCDGELIGEANGPTLPSILNTTDNVQMGKRYDNENHFPGLIDDVRIYNKVLTLEDIREIMTPSWAWRQYPADGATGVPRQLTLTWAPGLDANSVKGHRVYFDDVKAKVTARNGCDVNDFSTDDPCYGPIGPLNLGQTYYWAVDEVNDPCLWEGDVWSFTVVNYIVVDDFDSYAGTAAPPPALRTVWKEGSPIATVWLNTDSNYVRDGNSMMYYYDLYYSPYSEAYATTAALPSGIGSNWNIGGVKALSLWFYGQAGNDANKPMYVKLTDGASKSAKIIYDGDMNDIRKEQWQEWNIALQEFVDACSVLNLANVSRITIGFGDGVATEPVENKGNVYFEDIRLYIPRCMPDTVPDSASGNCLIDYPDLQILTNNWLISEYDVVPVEPNNNNLIGWWKLDEGAGTIAADSSINDNNGNLAGDPNSKPKWVAGHIGSALDFNGVTDYVDCSNDVSLNEPNITGKITLAAWVKTNDCGNSEFNPYITKGDHAYTLQQRSPAGTGINELEIAIYGTGTTWYFASTPVDSSFNGVWHHLAGTYNGSQVKLYVDGELNAITDYVGPIATSTANVNLGKSSDFTDRWYEGALDDVRIYSRALSQEEVAYLAERSTFTQPLEPLLTPHNPGINLYKDGTIDLRDYAVLASKWLEEVLWPAVP